MTTGAFDLGSTFLRLRSDAAIERLPVGADFWPGLIAGRLGDFHHEYLVSIHAFDADWSVWEMHPEGDEVVCLLSGAATFVLEESGGERRVEITECGGAVFVPRGVWHTALTRTPTRMLFITAGEGTQHRPVRG